jgi:hypothetical protein
LEKVKIELIDQLLIFTVNRPGVLANICGSLTDKKINIIGISVMDHRDYAMIRMVVSDSKTAMHLLGEVGLPVSDDEVVRISLSEGPGSLEKLANILSEASINIIYAYATEPLQKGKSAMILKTNDDRKAIKLLRKKYNQ